MIGHRFAHSGRPLAPLDGCLFEYRVAANGVFIRAEKPGLGVQLCLAPAALRGLAELPERVRLERVPREGLLAILAAARAALPDELLVYLLPQGGGWQAVIPAQVQSPAAVHPVDPHDPACARALIEVHSHNRLPAFFSEADDREERFGFRVYAVLGRVDTARPEIRVRVGVYGHLVDIPPEWVFDLPEAFLPDGDALIPAGAPEWAEGGAYAAPD